MRYNNIARWKRRIHKRLMFPLFMPVKKGVLMMSEEKKSTYKGNTDARRKASRVYLAEKVEDIRIRVQKGQKPIIKAHAESMGESVNSFIVRAINEAMARDKEGKR